MSRESGRWTLIIGTRKRIVRRDKKELEELEDKKAGEILESTIRFSGVDLLQGVRAKAFQC